MKDIPYEKWSLFGRGEIVLFEKVDIGFATRTLVFGIVDEVDFGKIACHDHGSIRMTDKVMLASCDDMLKQVRYQTGRILEDERKRGNRGKQRGRVIL